MYKWVNEDDTTTYSNQPPADASSVREATVIEQLPPVTRVITRPAEAERQPATGSASTALESEAAPRVAAMRSRFPQAVQDPCLTSSDRYCYQKNSAQYRPYVGYSPGGENVTDTNQAVVPPPRGASSSTAGTGSVAGGSRAVAARTEQK
jgi:hypothetical protein